MRLPSVAGVNYPLYPTKAAAVSPSDSTVFAEPSTIYVGIGGVVAVIPWDSASVVNFTIPTGGVVPCTVRQVYSTNTTATTMVRVYYNE